MLDKTGRLLKVGQVVDVYISDVMKAVVIEINEGTLCGPGGRPSQPMLRLSTPVHIELDHPNGRAPVYILAEPKTDGRAEIEAAGIPKEPTPEPADPFEQPGDDDEASIHESTRKKKRHLN